MSTPQSVDRDRGPEDRGSRVRAYLRRFFTSWVAEDPEPEYSALDREDGLGLFPDPVCTPRSPVPESPEVAAHTQTSDGDRSMVGGRAGL